MRTTLSIDDDVLQAVKDRARYEKRTAGEVATDLIREGLRYPPTPPASTLVVHKGFVALPSRGGIVTNEIVDRIRDEEGI